MSEETNVPAPVETPPVTRRWDPLQSLTALQADLDRFWGERPSLLSLRRWMEPASTWSPKIDVFQKNGALVVKAEVPGIPKESIDVSVEEGDLVIRGERKTEDEVKETDYYRMERSYGSFFRRIPLPEGVEADSIKATFHDGVLEVTVPTPPAKESSPVKVAVH
ncbi:MAG: Hsp20/alpha crystallin family protein [Thermomicrobiales bacterium]|nr:Hsp20/alpha crystallin family protein [Thermomicrobiales bacterium]